MGHISTLKLHQLRYGELSDADTQTLQAHLDACAQCTARLTAQSNHREAFALQPMPPALLQTAPWWQRGLAWLKKPLILAPIVAAAAALLIVTSPTERSKGSSDIEILVDYGGEPVVLQAGEAIRPGDRLQLRIPPGEWVEVWVGDGEQWLGSFPVEPSHQWQLVPFSLEVDSAPGSEHIAVLLSNHILQAEEADDALDGDALGGVEIERIILHKEL